MELSQNLVVTHAKSQHLRGKSLSREAVLVHEDLQGTGSPRFYTWSSKLVNSIHALKVKVLPNGFKGEVVAGEKYATAVETGEYSKTGEIDTGAIGVELGTPNRRAFPFLGPAITESAPAIILLFAKAVRRAVK